MKRPARIALNVLLPPLLAAGCFVAVMCVAALGESFNNARRSLDKTIGDIAQFGFLAILFAYVIAGLPSILHAGLMELSYQKFPADRWAAVGVSAASGSLAGFLMSAFLSKGATNPGLFILVPLGAFVGFLLGAFIKWLSRSKSDNPRPTLRGCE